jgi:hypothetical protein
MYNKGDSMNAWTWTVFQLMTQAAMNDHDEKIKAETTNFISNLLDNKVIDFPGIYK